MWIPHAHALKLRYSPANLTLLIWLLAQLEFRRWEEKYWLFSSQSSSLKFVSWTSPFLSYSKNFPGSAYLFTGFRSFELLYLLKQIWAPHLFSCSWNSLLNVVNMDVSYHPPIFTTSDMKCLRFCQTKAWYSQLLCPLFWGSQILCLFILLGFL